MNDDDVQVVTGAFGFTGGRIAAGLLQRGVRVRSLTNRSPGEDSFDGRVEAVSYRFDDVPRLTDALRGARVLYNTYWIRYPHRHATHSDAVRNSKTLIRCAVDAGIRRFVHISVSNPDEDSPLSYFRGKAEVERALIESGLSYAILRPTLLFGSGDVLINNIAWMLRKLPVFGVFGSGDYRVQPVHVDDVAALAILCGAEDVNHITDAVGPETTTFLQLVQLVRQAVRGRARIVHVSPRLALAIGGMLGWFLRDIIITREEIEGLMANLLISRNPPTCSTGLSTWLDSHADQLGRRYAGELGRHYRVPR
ncbi:MAG: NAD(P)H-binding protein [Phycisphaerae bacterium]